MKMEVVDVSSRVVKDLVDFIFRNDGYRHSLISAFVSIGDVGWEEAKRVFVEDTGACSSVAGAVSFYGRRIERHGVVLPSGDELGVMVDGVRLARQASVVRRRYVRRKSEKPIVAAAEYYRREGFWSR
tara:strand:+ start:847 stop:1230 length:384 start_codon:yes stop_codon:yes gene_type:complete